MGCLFAMFAGVFPRLALFILWVARPARVDELAMDQQEARALLEGAGVGLADAEVAELASRTEGWPVGLYLAALALQARGQQHHAGFESPRQLT